MDGVQLFQGFKTTARKVYFLQFYFLGKSSLVG